MAVETKVFKAFKEALDVDDSVDISTLVYREFPTWNSVGHMTLIAALESEFDTMLETDDILAMNNYNKAVEIMTRYSNA